MDSGSGPNIIKRNSVAPDTAVDKNEILRLSGITTHHVTTLGQALIDILGYPVAFHLVENDFPIPQNGILGSDFFKQFQAKVNYEQNQLEWNNVCIPFEEKEETLVIPARTISQMHIKVANPELKEGYIPERNRWCLFRKRLIYSEERKGILAGSKYYRRRRKGIYSHD